VAKEAGYACNQSAGKGLKVLSANGVLQAALKRKGIDDDAIVAKIKQVMGAKKAVPPNSIMVPDFRAQAIGADMALKIMGGYAPVKIEDVTPLKVEYGTVPKDDPAAK